MKLSKLLELMAEVSDSLEDSNCSWDEEEASAAGGEFDEAEEEEEDDDEEDEEEEEEDEDEDDDELFTWFTINKVVTGK